ncbi:hypothetical protein ACFYY3_29710 [Streptomyces sp. NPDC001812]|uniref:hypothetical protein n=1 Tax=Streptomyces TaxID=1883 RepID=UPI00311AD497
MTLAVNGLLGGIDCGVAGGGRLREHAGPATGRLAPVTAAARAPPLYATRRGAR